MHKVQSTIQHPIFWIGLFFLIRLVGLQNPPLETGHNWRQVTGLMVSRNFTEINSNILYPRVDDNQGKTGIIGMEFPLMNYLYSGLAKLFGYQHWYGRLIGLLMSSLGSFYYYRILRNQFDERIALYSLIALSASIWFAYSRKMMPDVFCISLFMPALYYGISFFKEGKNTNLLLYTAIGCLAILSKIPAAIYGILFLPFLLSRKYKFKLKLKFALSSVLMLSIVFLWYFWWCPKLSAEFGFWYNIGKPLNIGFGEIVENFDQAFKNFYFHSFYSYAAFLLALAGFVKAWLDHNKKLLLITGLLFPIFLFYVFKSGFYFYHHNYYIIPIVPLFALLLGYGLSKIPNQKWAFILLFICCAESIANQQHDFFLKSNQLYKLKIESMVESVVPKGALVVINIPDNPQQLYLSHRKGWLSEEKTLLQKKYINQLKKEGCEYLIVDRKFWESKKPAHTLVLEDSNYWIFKL